MARQVILRSEVPNAEQLAFREDKAFMEWLRSVEPDWELEYSGQITFAYMAWLAGIENVKKVTK